MQGTGGVIFKIIFKNLFIILVALGLVLHIGLLSLVTTGRGYSLVVVCGLLTAMASLVVRTLAWAPGHRLNSCGTQA